MHKKQKILQDNTVYDYALALLERRGVQLTDIAEIVYDLQKDYVEGLNLDTCLENINAVLLKREVQNAIITGIELDMAADQGHLSPILSDMLKRDEGLYGIDEILVLSIVNVYGSIGFTNFSYVDKIKPGIVGRLNADKVTQCNTFIDDIVGAIAAAAASRIAHAQPAAKN